MKIPTIKQMEKWSQKEADNFVNEGLAEVCEDLAEYTKNPKEKKQFLKYANTFRKLGKIYNVKPNKSKLEVINMAKKLTEQEKEVRETRKVLKKIRTLEKKHPQHIVERACFKYKNWNLEKRKAQKKMKELEEELEKTKRRLR